MAASPLDDPPDGRDEGSALATIVEGFEAAWQAGPAPQIAPFLPGGDPALRRAAAIELVMIDLEYRWRRGGPGPDRPLPPGPPEPLRIEDYWSHREAFGLPECVPVDVIVHEYRVRRRWGDRPTRDDILGRFPGSGPALRAELERVDAELPDRTPEPIGHPTDGIPRITDGGRYEIRRELGSGGIGRVWLAFDRRLRREVAVKEVLPDRAGDDALQARLLREAEITGRLQHPGVVPVHDVAPRPAAGRAYYVMRPIHGQTLSQAIADYHRSRDSADRSRYELSPLLEALIAVCNTVGFAHARGVIHRDLKGSNIVLGGFGEVIVLDWGFAKDLRGGSSHDADGESDGDGPMADRPGGPDGSDRPGAAGGSTRHQVLGTPAYMAPEQARGRHGRVGPTTDVFGLGAILYEILAGRPPFGGRSFEEVLARVRACDFAPPRRHNPGAPRALEAVCLKAMAEAPGDRYASAMAMADDLRRWIAGEPVAAMPEPGWARWRRRIARHRTAFASALVGLAVALGSGGFMLYRGRIHEVGRREEARRHAEQVRDLSYIGAERAAREASLQPAPGWIERGLGLVAEASRGGSPLRDAAGLRTLAARFARGIDARPRARLTSMSSACLAFSPDGRLAVGEHHGAPEFRVVVFDPAGGAPTAEFAIRADDEAVKSRDIKRTGISALAFSPDGSLLAAGVRNGDLLIWDTTRTRPDPLILPGRGRRVVRLQFSPDGARLISGEFDGAVSLRDARSGWREARSLTLPGGLCDAALSHDGALLAYANLERIRVLDVSGLGDFTPDPEDIRSDRDVECHRLRFSPVDRTLARADWRFIVQYGDPETSDHRELIDRDYGATHDGDLSSMDFSPDGTLLATGSPDDTVKLWDLAAAQLVLTLPARTESVVYPAFGPDGSTLAVATSGGTTVYDLLGRDVMTTRGQHIDRVQGFCFRPGASPDATDLLAFGDRFLPGESAAERVISREDVDGLVPRADHRFKMAAGGTRPAFAIEGQPGGRLVACQGIRQITLYDVEGFRPLRELPIHEPPSLGFSPDGRWLWGVLDELKVVSWRLPSLEIRTSWEDPDRDRLPGRVGITCLAAGTHRVVAGSRAGLVYVLRAVDGGLERTFAVGDPVQSIALSPDESVIVCGTRRGSLERIRLAAGVRAPGIEAHRGAIPSVAIHPAGRIVATGSRDRTVALWDLGGPEPEELIRLTSPSDRPVNRVRFSPDGRLLGMLVQEEHAVRLWHLDRLRARLEALGLNWSDAAP